jgi:hypothetical protein
VSPADGLGRLNRLTKWRSVFAGWQLGTRHPDDPECQAVRDHREVTILLRAEVNALTGLLIAKGVFTAEEFAAQLDQEADALSAAYERKFPGMHATDQGIEYQLPEVIETMKGWRP